ncbi:unnamed protein product [Clonostachys rhizophaga]|uniref:SMP-30/Gluconolactonase/LRE-like region domain-containing protein n=1 Tax=Clonostachys rhizophaga TaxID=160324 RepID=A0A9N9VGH6_9HYPO|nr:unnamed protein product [Clonostachys rhizophaga]
MSSISAATLVFNNSDFNFENSIIRSNGNLLVTTITSGILLDIDIQSESPSSRVVATFGDYGILGIDSVGEDTYAIAAGIPSSGLSPWSNGTSPEIETAASIDADLPDGLATVPTQPDIVLVSDALAGTVIRVNVTSGESEITLKDDLLVGNPGVNGLKILDGYVYFVNTDTRYYGKFAITEDGQKSGDIQVISTDASSDDFAFDKYGIAYIGPQRNPSVVRVFPNGTATRIAQNAEMGRPCSLTLAEDGLSGYVTTTEGQIFKFEIPAL